MKRGAELVTSRDFSFPHSLHERWFESIRKISQFVRLKKCRLHRKRTGNTTRWPINSNQRFEVARIRRQDSAHNTRKRGLIDYKPNLERIAMLLAVVEVSSV